MDTTTRDNGSDRVAAVVALIALPFAIYLAGWVIDWSGGPFVRYVLPVVFCIAVPSIIGSTVGAAVRATRRH